MNHLVIVAHGSRVEASNDEVRLLTERLRPLVNHQYEALTCAFLELAPPSIPEALDHAIAAGATTVTVLPYFLSIGRHVAIDVPEIVSQKQKEYPQVSLVLKPYLGTATQQMTDLIAKIALETP